MVRIPEEYQEVEYIGSTGTQYILTNYIPTITENMKIQLNYMFTVAQTGENMIFGSTASGGSRKVRFQCEYYYNSDKWYIGSGINQFRQVLSSIGNKINVRYTLFINGESLIINNQSIDYTQKWTSDSNALPMCIFAINWANTIRYANRGIKIYKLIFTANGVKEAEFVPCYRKSDNEIGMYDTISKTFYTNSGTGTFLKGHNVYYDSINLLEQRRKILLAQRKKIQVTWNQAQPPFSTSTYRPYLDSRTSLEDIDNGIVKQIWSGGTGGGYGYTTCLKEALPIVQTDHIYYLSYMINPSKSGNGWGIEFAGGTNAEMNVKCAENTWNRLSAVSQGVRNGYGIAYFGNRRSGASSIGDYVLLKSPIYIDLTQMFGSGNEPDLETFEKQCIKNQIDLTQSYPQDLNGTTRWWVI